MLDFDDFMQKLSEEGLFFYFLYIRMIQGLFGCVGNSPYVQGKIKETLLLKVIPQDEYDFSLNDF